MSSMMYGYGYSSIFALINFIFCIAIMVALVYITCMIVLSFVKKYKIWQWENEHKYLSNKDKDRE